MMLAMLMWQKLLQVNLICKPEGDGAHVFSGYEEVASFKVQFPLLITQPAIDYAKSCTLPTYISVL